MSGFYDFECPLGWVRVCWEDEAVTSVLRVDHPGVDAVAAPIALEVQRQLSEYFAGKRKEFSLPLKPAGTAFQKAVWQALLEIPYGQTRTYGQIAAAVGNPNAARAVGLACNRNPVWIVIPCHRVVGKAGLTGYAGGLALKQQLLEIEQRMSL